MRGEPVGPGLRPYRGEQDLRAMHSVLVDGRKAAGPVYYAHVGDLNWWLFYLEPDLRERTYLCESGPDGRVVGWVLFSLRFRAFDVFVHPDPSLNELRLRLFLWAEQEMAAIVREQGGAQFSTTWVSEADGELIAHLQSRGFVRSDEHLFYMQRSLAGPISAPPLPPGYCVRSVAGEEEVGKRAAVSHAAFGSSTPLGLYTEGTRRFMNSPVYTPDLDLVAVAPDGRFAAFCICWLDGVNRVGHLEPVATHPEFRRLGMGAAVVGEGLRRMKAQGMRSAGVVVDSDNLTGRRLYESVGFRPVLRIQPYRSTALPRLP